MDALTPTRAQALIADWERDHADQRGCEFFRPGTFDLDYGEHRCRRCGVPAQTHQAYRLLNTVIGTHG